MVHLLLVVAALAATISVRPMASAEPLPEVAVDRTTIAAADTFVSDAVPDDAFGTATRLLVGGGPPRRIALLHLDVPEVEGRLVSATLWLHVADRAGAGGPAGGTVIATSDTDWDESTVTWNTRPALDGAVAGPIGAVQRGRWVSRNVTALARPGERLSLGIRSRQADSVAYDGRGSGFAPRLVLRDDAPPDGVIVDAVGDMVCGAGAVHDAVTCHDVEVSDMVVDDPDVQAFLALGDLQYNDGSLEDFQTYYEPTYGRVREITHPVIGNHKYHTPDGDGYWDYWGAQAGPRDQGWYSFDLGDRWHLVALNTNCDEVGCGSTSAQVQWLRADLAANDRPCVLAFAHHPRWSSGKAPGNNPTVDPFVRVLQRNGVELLVSGHSHNYERFARQRPDGTVAADGIRQFVVGTGGRSVGPANGFERPFSANSQFRLAHVFGLLRLSLTDTGYWWSFVDELGRVRDSGTNRCT
jgi:hypothetical protein